MRTQIDKKQGSVLGATLILAVAIAIVFAGLIRWSHHEQEVTLRHVGLAKARMTTESVGEFGEAQIIARLEKLTYFPDDEFMPHVRPVVLPSQEVLTIDPSTILSELLTSLKTGGLAGLAATLKSLKDKSTTQSTTGTEASPDKNNNGGTNGTPPPDSGFFQYELTPENIVVGRFDAGHWERAQAGDPLYRNDPLIDQTLLVREVRMVSAARAVDRRKGTTMRAFSEYLLQVRDAPVWGNVLFYNMDLEIAPGVAMEIQGPVHANGDIYVQSGETVRFNDNVTSAGHLYYGLTGGATNTGDVAFRKTGTTSEFVSLYQDGAWLDSKSPVWTETASARWAGSLRTREHGINPAIMAGIAPYVPDNPSTAANELQNSAHALIEPAVPETATGFPGYEVEVQKFASKACLVLEVAVPGDVSLYKFAASDTGTYVRNTVAGPQRFVRQQLSMPAGLIVGDVAGNKFYDKRRAQWVFSADLDVGKLKTLIETEGQAAAFTKSGVTFDPATEWNGVVYVTHAQTATGAIRLVNGGSVPDRATQSNGNTRGFTLATNVPLYVQGNYNADGQISSDGALIRQPDSQAEPPAGLAADAITILSQGWSDTNSQKDLDQRTARQTEVSAALLLGIVPTNKNGNGIYSGGVENLPRFLENWAGVKLGYRGSMVVLFESTSAVEPWSSSNVYAAPFRVWGFNALFAQGILPPGTPTSRTYRRVGFRDMSEPEYEATLTAIANE